MRCASVKAEPILWRSEDGGNGHYYEVVRPEGGITWTNAKEAAENRQFRRVYGHLATVGSEFENDFIVGQFAEEIDGTLAIWAWIGLSDMQREGVFRWVTGELFEYSNWGGGQRTEQRRRRPGRGLGRVFRRRLE